MSQSSSRSMLTLLLVLTVVLLGIVASTLAQETPDNLPVGVATDETPQPGQEALSLEGVVDGLPATSSVVELSRGRLLTGAGWELSIPGPAIYGVESGALGVRVNGPAVLSRAGNSEIRGADEEAEPGVDYTLWPGDQILVRPGTAHLIRNDGQESTSFLSFVIFPTASAIPSWLPDNDLPSGVEVQPLASDVVTTMSELEDGAIEISIARTTIPRNEDVPLTPTGFTLLVVESGTLFLGTGQTDGDNQALESGAVVRLEADSPIVARNAGTADLILLTVHIDSAAPGAPEATDE